MRNQITRIFTSSVAALFAIATYNASALAGGGLFDQLQQMGGPPSEAAPVSSAAASTPPKLGTFASSGRITETLQTGACPGSLEDQSGTVCATTPSDCDQLAITGAVTATGLGNSNLLSACITLDNSALSTNLSVCFNGLGTGTVTADSGKSSLKLDLGGVLCIANGSPLATPTSVDFVFTGTYAVSGGTGVDATAVGTGAASFNDLVTNLTVTPLTGTGELQLTGNSAKF
jgi:hypothetical protein